MCDLSTLEPGQEIEIGFKGKTHRTIVLATNADTVVTIDNIILDGCKGDDKMVRLINPIPSNIYRGNILIEALINARDLGCNFNDLGKLIK